ncbi:glycosyltransferase [Sphingobacterium chungjuense]|uniref:glycosyltransferase n=1 Tax=Sphingobacterium chungjuense TaxID=2675553 RepID=UPI0014074550|nr:glycosyltransferase [Sphingobacterium chungjuense]
MKIQFIITDYGSFNNFLGDVAVELSRNSHEVHVICSPDRVIKVADHYDYAAEGIHFTFVDLPRGFNPFKHWRVSRIIHQKVAIFQPDIVSIHFTTGIFTTTFHKRLPYRTVGTFHGLGYPVVEGLLKRIIYKYVESRSLRRIDEAWVLNKSDYQLLNQDFPNNIIYQLPTKGLGCDLIRFDPDKFTAVDRLKMRQQLEIKESSFVLCFTGRFVFFKGFYKVLRAFKELIDRSGDLDLHLILIGGQDNAHPTGLNDEETSWMATHPNVHNIGFSSEVEKYLSITDLFVFPSEKEGMPVCIIEALAMGVPVLTSDSRGCHDLIVHERNGLISGSNPTPEKIAADIDGFIHNTELQQSIKKNIVIQRPSLDRRAFVEQQLKYFTGKENQSDITIDEI